jgi:hypothetical protein
VSGKNLNHRTVKKFYVGMSGTGKSTLFSKHISAEKARLKFVFDHMGDFSEKMGLPSVVDFEGVYKAASIGGWIVFDPIRLASSIIEFKADGTPVRLGKFRALELFAEVVLEICKIIPGRKLFIMDEIQKIVGSTGQEPTELLNLLDTGRHFAVDFFGVSIAPNRVHNVIRGAMTEIYSFRMTESNALKFLTDNGFDETKIRTLKNGKYFYRNVDTGETGEGGKAF